MNPERDKKRQGLKVIISEAIMVLTVIVTVIILALVVSGYWLNSDFKVERQGMLQVYSYPTGANVEIDGTSSWLQRTNTSKVLSTGEHTIKLTREGYDSWSKTVNISEGLLYRLGYPRLFLIDRTKEEVLSIDAVSHATVTPDHSAVLLTNNTTEWTYIVLSEEKVAPKKIDVSSVFTGVSVAEGAKVGILSDEILKTSWDYDGTHALIKAKAGEQIEWILLDVKNNAKSVNLTHEFGGDFSEIKILDNSANNLIAVQNGNLHKIDVSARSISAVLAKNVVDFDHYNSEIVFAARNTGSSSENKEESNHEYLIGFMKTSNGEVEKVAYTDSAPMVTISRFYDTKYITVVEQNKATLYQEEDFSVFKKYELGFIPTSIEVGHQGEFITMSERSHIASLDMEANLVREWDIENEKFGRPDNNMIYVVDNGDLVFYDFDGLNRRVLAHNVSSKFPVSITSNKWLYYFSDNSLVREVIAN